MCLADDGGWLRVLVVISAVACLARCLRTAPTLTALSGAKMPHVASPCLRS